MLAWPAVQKKRVNKRGRVGVCSLNSLESVRERQIRSTCLSIHNPRKEKKERREKKGKKQEISGAKKGWSPRNEPQMNFEWIARRVMLLKVSWMFAGDERVTETSWRVVEVSIPFRALVAFC